MTNYQVIVGNIGTVYDGDSKQEAYKVYSDYVHQSKYCKGRPSGESVTIMVDGEPENEFTGLIDREPDYEPDPLKRVLSLLVELQERIYHDADQLGPNVSHPAVHSLFAAIQPARDKLAGL